MREYTKAFLVLIGVAFVIFVNRNQPYIVLAVTLPAFIAGIVIAYLASKRVRYERRYPGLTARGNAYFMLGSCFMFIPVRTFLDLWHLQAPAPFYVVPGVALIGAFVYAILLKRWQLKEPLMPFAFA